MMTYSVAHVANGLNVNEETVRRWIRSGKLKSTMSSRKVGCVISEQELLEFMEANPKYGRELDISSTIKNTYRDGLHRLLNELLDERDVLDKRIAKVESLLKEES